MNLFFRLKSVLVLNNINTYFFKNLAAIYEEAKIYLEYLFLYLFDYNLIKKFFFILKA